MSERSITAASILVVDDEPANVVLLERMLKKKGYENVRSETDSRNVARLFTELQPDLVLLDLAMPHVDGFEVLEQLNDLSEPGTYNPVLVLTADVRREAKERALSAGAKDYLTKPLDAMEVLLRVKNLLETRLLHLALRDQNRELERRVEERTRELHDAYLDTVERLARASEYRDDATGRSTFRMGETAGLIAMQLGLPKDEVDLIRRVAPLHDIGKIGIPDSILLKPGKLNAEEAEAMRAHTKIGVELLSGSRSTLLQMAADIARCHHERWDGQGYLQLKGEEIPLPARIAAVADVFDSITSKRPFRPARSVESAVAEIAAERGKQFDPSVVDAFLRLYGGKGSGAAVPAPGPAAADPSGAGVPDEGG